MTGRNKLITEAFYLTKDIEKYGSGYRRVRKQIAEYPTMYFNFEENSGGCLVEVGYKKQKISKNVPLNVPLNTRQKKMLEDIQKNNYITQAEMSEKYNVTEKTIKRDLQYLQENNIVKREGSKKTGYWKIKE